MKKNKILAGLSALVMGATMMAGTAMSASAATVYDCEGNTLIAATYSDQAQTLPGTGGGFWAYYQNNTFTTLGWHPAPHGMYDGMIYNKEMTLCDCEDGNCVSGCTPGEVSFYVTEYTYSGMTGSISSIYLASDQTDPTSVATTGSNLLGADDIGYDENGDPITINSVSLDPSSYYVINVTMTTPYSGTHSQAMRVQVQLTYPSN